MLIISAAIVTIGLNLFKSKSRQIEYQGFFNAKIIRVLGTSGQMSYGAVIYKERQHRVRSTMLLRLNQKVCIGIIESSRFIRLRGYIVVDDAKCR